MADEIDKAGGEPANGVPRASAGAVRFETFLPQVESPSICPLAADSAFAPKADAAIPFEGDSPIAPVFTAMWPSFSRKAQRRRSVLFAASLVLAAATATVTGFALGGVKEQHAIQQTVAHLTKEVATLKSSLAAANQPAQNGIARIGDRLNEVSAEFAARDGTLTTGSISMPETVSAQGNRPFRD